MNRQRRAGTERPKPALLLVAAAVLSTAWTVATNIVAEPPEAAADYGASSPHCSSISHSTHPPGKYPCHVHTASVWVARTAWKDCAGFGSEEDACTTRTAECTRSSSSSNWPCGSPIGYETYGGTDMHRLKGRAISTSVTLAAPPTTTRPPPTTTRYVPPTTTRYVPPTTSSPLQNTDPVDDVLCVPAVGEHAHGGFRTCHENHDYNNIPCANEPGQTWAPHPGHTPVPRPLCAPDSAPPTTTTTPVPTTTSGGVEGGNWFNIPPTTTVPLRQLTVRRTTTTTTTLPWYLECGNLSRHTHGTLLQVHTDGTEMGLCHSHVEPDCTNTGTWLAIIDNDSHSLATTETCGAPPTTTVLGVTPPPTTTSAAPPPTTTTAGPCPSNKYYDPDHPDADPDGCVQRAFLN